MPREKRAAPQDLEIYDLRRGLAKHIPGAPALVRNFGFDEVEVPDFYGLTAGGFREQLSRGHLRCTATLAQHDRLSQDLNGVIAVGILAHHSCRYPLQPVFVMQTA